MATIGLKVASDPYTSDSLSLADTLAKGIFGDPEGQMKARALASEVGVRMASRDKLIADTGLINIKTREEQANADALDRAERAGPLAANAAADANMPVPVEGSHLTAPGTTGYGPQPAIVDASTIAAKKMHDAIVAQNNAIWGAVVRNSNGEQLAKAPGIVAGQTVLEQGLVPGARPSGTSLRIAGGLANGSAPTTSTVWSPDDTAGVDAAARQKIAEEAAKSTLPAAPKDVTYRGQPGIVRLDANGNPVYTGAIGTEQNPEKPDLVDLPGGGKGTLVRDAQGNPVSVKPLPGAESRPEKQDIIDLPNGGKGTAVRDAQGNVIAAIPIPGAGPKQEIVDLPGGGKGSVTRDATGKVIDVQPIQGAEGRPEKPQIIEGPDKTPYAVSTGPGGAVAGTPVQGVKPAPAPPLYQGKTDKADALNRIEAIRQKLASKQPLSQEEAGLYETDLNLAYGPVNEKITDAATGKTTINQVSPKIPDNVPTVNDVRKAASLPLLPPPPPEPKQNSKPPNEQQQQLQLYAQPLVNSTTKLDKVKPLDVPGAFIQRIMGIDGTDPNLVQQLLASTSFVSPQQREFAQSVAEYNQSLLYMLSGKAITDGEYKRAMLSYIPRPSDNASQLAWKADQRHSIIANAVRLGWGNDPDTGKIVKANIKRSGIDLDKYDLTIPQPDGGDAGGGGGSGNPASRFFK